MRADMVLQFDQPELNALRDVWNLKAKLAGGLPSRSDFDARTLKPLLAPHPWIESAHPSPLSAHNGFFGSRPFSRANALLAEQGAEPIDWLLP